eukprot:scaffold59889_cov63-Phaeocystis_antarctica.AAC.1
MPGLGEREYPTLQTQGLPQAEPGTPAALQRSFSARSDRTVDMSMDMSHDDMTFAGLSDCDEVEAVQPASGAPGAAQAARHGRRAGRPAAEELAEETLDLSASFDQLDTSQLDMEEPVRRSTRPGAALQQLALDEVQANDEYGEDDFLEESLASIPSPPVSRGASLNTSASAAARAPAAAAPARALEDPLETSFGSVGSKKSLREMQQSISGRQERQERPEQRERERAQPRPAPAPAPERVAPEAAGPSGDAQVARLAAELRETKQRLASAEAAGGELRRERDDLQARLGAA